MTSPGTRVVALLRGINVGGNKLVPMARLRALVESLGLQEVSTHLQSGNVVFSCDRKALTHLASDLERAIETEFGFGSSVILRSADEWAEAMAADPLLHLVTDPARHIVGFCADEPSADGRSQLEHQDFGVDEVRVAGSHVYMWCPAGLSASPIFKLNLDRTLGTAVTARNWRTVTKLASMLDPAP